MFVTASIGQGKDAPGRTSLRRVVQPLAVFLLCHSSLPAAEYCVADEDGLRAALAGAAQSAEADHVRIQAGTITLGQALSFSARGSPTGALTVSGGWNANCAQKEFGAQHTKIEASAPLVHVGLSPDGDLIVRDLHFVNIPQGIGLSNNTLGPALTTLRMSRVAVFNDAAVGDALALFTPADRIEVDNLLVDAMAGCAVAAATFDDAGELTIRSSTLIARGNPVSGFGGSAICFDGAPQADLNHAVNTVFQSADGVDVLVNGRPVVMESSAYSDIDFCANCGLSGPLDPASGNNLVQPMAFDETATGALARFVRIGQSMLLIPGLADTGADQNTLQYPFDVIGYPRLSGAAQDRGAFELPGDDAVFRDGFDDT